MSRGAAEPFRTLAGEAILDAIRRRIVAAIAVLALLSLWVIRGCTGCDTGSYTVNGQPIDPGRIAGLAGVVLYLALALWTMLLAGVLAADHLTQTLDDGSALLTLARPVGRGTFALARLAGSLAVALGTGAVLLAATAGLLHLRQGLPLAPAALAAAACALGGVVVGALAMAVSLLVPRAAAALLAVGLVGGVAALDLAASLGVALGGAAALVDGLGPPLAAAPLHALAPWLGRAPASPAALESGLRLLLWAAASVAVLVAAFRRVEIRA